MAIQAIERKKVSDEVFEQIKAMIASGNWKPGDKLPSEKELTELFGVSRVTIREALKKLASYNIIETSQGRGSFIRNMEGVSLFDNIMLSVYVNSAEEVYHSGYDGISRYCRSGKRLFGYSAGDRGRFSSFTREL